MTTHLRALSVLCVSTLVGGLMFIGVMAFRADNESQEFESPAARADMNAYFFEMRLFGNPEADIQASLWNAYRNLQARGASAFLKPSAGAAGNVWTEIGPWNIGGRVRSIVTSPADPNVIYAGSASGGVWKSVDFGANWSPCTDDMPLLGIGAVAMDPNNPDRIFAGTGEPLGQFGRGNYTFVLSKSKGILRSDDAGKTWTMLNWPSSTISGVHRIAVSPVTADTFLVATMADLWKTTTAGVSWTRVNTGVCSDVVYKPGDSSTVYAAIGADYGGYRNGVYVSYAGGNSGSWIRLSKNFPSADSCGRIVLGVCPADPQRLYAAVALNRSKMPSSAQDFLLFMTSSDGGAIWTRRINALAKNITNGQAWYDLGMTVSPTDPNVIFVGGYDTHRSTNGGVSFSGVQGSAHVDIHAFAFKTNDSKSVVMGCDGGIFISTNLGAAWFHKSNALGNVQYYSCNYDPSHPTWVFGGTQDNGTHSHISGGNNEWSMVYGGDGGNVAIDPGDWQFRFVTSMSVNSSGNNVRPIVRTGPGGNAWLSNGLGEGPASDRFSWMPVVMFHPTDKTKLFTTSQFVYMMKNPSGTNPRWLCISTDLAPGGGVISDIAIPASNSSYMYTGSSTGKVYMSTNFLAASPTWVDVSNGLPSRWIADITCDKDDYQTVYIAFSGIGGGHAYKTTNAGASWVNISGDLPDDLPAGAILQSKTDANTLFLGTDLGVFATTNGGTNWQRFGTGMPNAVVYDMKMTPDGTIIAATHGRGMFVASSLLDVEHPSGVPSSTFALGQSYPHPATGSHPVSLPITVLKAGMLRVELYRSDGARVRTITSQWTENGVHTLQFDVRDLPAGVYVCSASMHGATVTRKLVVLR
jgi:hypothetical protein